ncbi:MAG TPA: ribonuclease III [Xanthobacteraceae bacterium]|nr:ribonuclease III [Xanthobacteraceae bacterium]
MGRALEPTVYVGAMSRKAKVTTGDGPTQGAGKEIGIKPSAGPREGGRRRKRSGEQEDQAARALEERIGYRFNDRMLLERALTHISSLAATKSRIGSYQRLEFLGDHVLGLVVSDMLFHNFPDADEGELSRRLADLVRRETCADIARAMDLGSAMKLGVSEDGAGGRRRTAILADMCEALIGATFIDGGFAAAADLIKRFWQERMLRPARSLRDPKTMLQEWAQARGMPTPSYREIGRSGPHHNPEFRVVVEVADRAPSEGIGRSKRAAEQAAAASMLLREGVGTGANDA